MLTCLRPLVTDTAPFFYSVFVYPALLTVAMTTLTFPNGTGQWLGGEVSPSALYLVWGSLTPPLTPGVGASNPPHPWCGGLKPISPLAWGPQTHLTPGVGASNPSHPWRGASNPPHPWRGGFKPISPLAWGLKPTSPLAWGLKPISPLAWGLKPTSPRGRKPHP